MKCSTPLSLISSGDERSSPLFFSYWLAYFSYFWVWDHKQWAVCWFRMEKYVASCPPLARMYTLGKCYYTLAFLGWGYGLDPRALITTPTGGSAQSVWRHGQLWQLAVLSVNSAAVLSVLVIGGPVNLTTALVKCDE